MGPRGILTVCFAAVILLETTRGVFISGIETIGALEGRAARAPVEQCEYNAILTSALLFGDHTYSVQIGPPSNFAAVPLVSYPLSGLDADITDTIPNDGKERHFEYSLIGDCNMANETLRVTPIMSVSTFTFNGNFNTLLANAETRDPTSVALIDVEVRTTTEVEIRNVQIEDERGGVFPFASCFDPDAERGFQGVRIRVDRPSPTPSPTSIFVSTVECNYMRFTGHGGCIEISNVDEPDDLDILIFDATLFDMLVSGPAIYIKGGDTVTLDDISASQVYSADWAQRSGDFNAGGTIATIQCRNVVLLDSSFANSGALATTAGPNPATYFGAVFFAHNPGMFSNVTLSNVNFENVGAVTQDGVLGGAVAIISVTNVVLSSLTALQANAFEICNGAFCDEGIDSNVEESNFVFNTAAGGFIYLEDVDRAAAKTVTMTDTSVRAAEDSDELAILLGALFSCGSTYPPPNGPWSRVYHTTTVTPFASNPWAVGGGLYVKQTGVQAFHGEDITVNQDPNLLVGAMCNETDGIAIGHAIVLDGGAGHVIQQSVFLGAGYNSGYDSSAFQRGLLAFIDTRSVYVSTTMFRSRNNETVLFSKLGSGGVFTIGSYQVVPAANGDNGDIVFDRVTIENYAMEALFEFGAPQFESLTFFNNLVLRSTLIAQNELFKPFMYYGATASPLSPLNQVNIDCCTISENHVYDYTFFYSPHGGISGEAFRFRYSEFYPNVFSTLLVDNSFGTFLYPTVNGAAPVYTSLGYNIFGGPNACIVAGIGGVCVCDTCKVVGDTDLITISPVLPLSGFYVPPDTSIAAGYSTTSLLAHTKCPLAINGDQEDYYFTTGAYQVEVYPLCIDLDLDGHCEGNYTDMLLLEDTCPGCDGPEIDLDFDDLGDECDLWPCSQDGICHLAACEGFDCCAGMECIVHYPSIGDFLSNSTATVIIEAGIVPFDTGTGPSNFSGFVVDSSAIISGWADTGNTPSVCNAEAEAGWLMSTESQILAGDFMRVCDSPYASCTTPGAFEIPAFALPKNGGERVVIGSINGFSTDVGMTGIWNYGLSESNSSPLLQYLEVRGLVSNGYAGVWQVVETLGLEFVDPPSSWVPMSKAVVLDLALSDPGDCDDFQVTAGCNNEGVPVSCQCAVNSQLVSLDALSVTFTDPPAVGCEVTLDVIFGATCTNAMGITEPKTLRPLPILVELAPLEVAAQQDGSLISPEHYTSTPLEVPLALSDPNDCSGATEWAVECVSVCPCVVEAVFPGSGGVAQVTFLTPPANGCGFDLVFTGEKSCLPYSALLTGSDTLVYIAEEGVGELQVDILNGKEVLLYKEDSSLSLHIDSPADCADLPIVDLTCVPAPESPVDRDCSCSLSPADFVITATLPGFNNVMGYYPLVFPDTSVENAPQGGCILALSVAVTQECTDRSLTSTTVVKGTIHPQPLVPISFLPLSTEKCETYLGENFGVSLQPVSETDRVNIDSYIWEEIRSNGNDEFVQPIQCIPNFDCLGGPKDKFANIYEGSIDVCETMTIRVTAVATEESGFASNFATFCPVQQAAPPLPGEVIPTFPPNPDRPESCDAYAGEFITFAVTGTSGQVCAGNREVVPNPEATVITVLEQLSFNPVVGQPVWTPVLEEDVSFGTSTQVRALVLDVSTGARATSTAIPITICYRSPEETASFISQSIQSANDCLASGDFACSASFLAEAAGAVVAAPGETQEELLEEIVSSLEDVVDSLVTSGGLNRVSSLGPLAAVLVAAESVCQVQIPSDVSVSSNLYDIIAKLSSVGNPFVASEAISKATAAGACEATPLNGETFDLIVNDINNAIQETWSSGRTACFMRTTVLSLGAGEGGSDYVGYARSLVSGFGSGTSFSVRGIEFYFPPCFQDELLKEVWRVTGDMSIVAEDVDCITAHILGLLPIATENPISSMLAGFNFWWLPPYSSVSYKLEIDQVRRGCEFQVTIPRTVRSLDEDDLESRGPVERGSTRERGGGQQNERETRMTLTGSPETLNCVTQVEGQGFVFVDDGCRLVGSDEIGDGSTVCDCTHLSNFGVLFSGDDDNEWTPIRIVSLVLLFITWFAIVAFFLLVTFSREFAIMFHLESSSQNANRILGREM